MIAQLTGTITTHVTGRAIITVAGVGYLVHIPTQPEYNTLSGTVTLHTYLAVRETALDLYGFIRASEYELFVELLGIPKVGPKSALQILSQATPTLIAEAVQQNDPAYLRKISRLGQKTCEAIILHLGSRDFFTTTLIESGPTSHQQDAAEALIALGYSPAAVQTFIRQQPPEVAAAELIKRGLQQL